MYFDRMITFGNVTLRVLHDVVDVCVSEIVFY